MADHDTHDHTGIPGVGGSGGTELDYVQVTSNTNITATAEASANTIITGSAVAYDGSTVVIIECWFEYVQQASADNNTILVLYDGSSSIGYIAFTTGPNATGYSGNLRIPTHGMRRITPSAATHTYSIRGFTGSGTAVAAAGAGGSGNHAPAFIRITRA